ncbi:MAG: heavy-metal-associated domain-containing protein [Treponema sp.]|jgi:copper ion binding protein|nr:heavy-metal-associated domain-containing protein [Treponema sp.]
MKTILNVEGMSCEHCVNHVTKEIKSVNGVKSVKVSLKDKKATIVHKDDISVEALKAAIVTAGYEAP